MGKLMVVGVAGLLALTACAPQERVHELEARVAELEALVDEMAALIGPTDLSKIEVTGTAVTVPRKDCSKGSVAVWERDGTLGCLSPTVPHFIGGYVLPFPATKGCMGSYLIMGPDGLTCDTLEHPYN